MLSYFLLKKIIFFIKVRKKNEFNQQKFIRTNKSFQSMKKIDQMVYLERLSAPKGSQMNHHRIKTNPTVFSSINSPNLCDNKLLFTSPKAMNTPQNSNNHTRFKSMAVSNPFKTQNSPNLSTKLKMSTFDASSKKKMGFVKPDFLNINPNLIISRNSRPKSSNYYAGSRYSMCEIGGASLASPKILTKERLSLLETPKKGNLNEIMINVSRSAKLRRSIFETYKDPKDENKIENVENERLQRRIKNLMLRKKEKKQMIGKFDKFFEKCDMEAALQNDETKTLEIDFKRFGRDYEKMQYTANKNVERANLYGSDTNFNKLRTQVKFKKKLIDHLLVRVSDKQDLLSMYNKYVSMEDNINKSKHIINE